MLLPSLLINNRYVYTGITLSPIFDICYTVVKKIHSSRISTLTPIAILSVCLSVRPSRSVI